ncbi:uncharacterized protein LY89DRAFT_691697 [Mollisia scopiformis]|uniref:Uncharacterized protein n=1 Tax=Mollisia scopiformis TaxID=149040 RepID=A0A132B5L2_MOLSC|nr:uncharacterized protein LY89DRAFT_691697 [Mollisia scopiformis]KUJ07631.1 hypothetical protein LY89DRAFT_691697 [Mollisia scopiformis]
MSLRYRLLQKWPRCGLNPANLAPVHPLPSSPKTGTLQRCNISTLSLKRPKGKINTTRKTAGDSTLLSTLSSSTEASQGLRIRSFSTSLRQRMVEDFLKDLEQAQKEPPSFYLDQYKQATPILMPPPGQIDTMDATTQPYKMPAGCHVIPPHLVDSRTDAEIQQDLATFKPVTSTKNFWGFYGTGFEEMPPHYRRNVETWVRRTSRQGWTVRILNQVKDHPLNVEKFLDTKDPDTVPKAFIDQKVGGDFSPQHVSDLVRFPLLLKYGGIYADVGCMLIGDLDRLWNSTVGDPNSKYEILTFNTGDPTHRSLTNYFMGSLPNNPYFERSHKLLVQGLWNADGGKTSTKGMHKNPLLKGLPLMGDDTNMTIKDKDGNVTHGPQEVSEMLTDYIIQGQAMGQVAGLIDHETGWNGPEYWAQHVYGIDYLQYSQLMNVYTQWNGQRAFDLMSLHLPAEGEQETPDQKEARTIVEHHLSNSTIVKLAQGIIVKVMGDTLGSLWQKNPGADNVEGTYAHWLRYGMLHWNQESIPPTQLFQVEPATKVGPLLRDE